jgi:hypothetical protein
MTIVSDAFESLRGAVPASFSAGTARDDFAERLLRVDMGMLDSEGWMIS